jgi:putative hydrolase of the HAD superfamily
MKAFVFDLDDTLYPEIEFVKSGFQVVAAYLGDRYGYNEKELRAKLASILKRDGRGKVFNTLLEELGLYSEANLSLLIHLYRAHKPNINLYKDALPTIERLKNLGISLALVTDGMASVQRNKLVSLGLSNYFDILFCTDELGREYWKPSTISFEVVLNLLDIKPDEAVYIGDNVSKDFLGPNSLGMHTIQVIRQKGYENSKNNFSPSYFPNFKIKNLKDIFSIEQVMQK